PAGRLLAKLARAAAAKLPLADACGAVAAAVLHEILQILLAIRVSDLLVRLYPPIGNDHDAAISADRPRVRLAGMVDVAGHVPARLAVDGPLLVEREQIARTARLAPVCFLVGDAAAPIGGDIGPALDRPCGEEAEPSSGPANPKDSRRHALRIPANDPD